MSDTLPISSITAKQRPEPRNKLLVAGRQLWETVTTEFALEAADLIVLEKACNAVDMASRHRQRLEKEGLTHHDRFGQIRLHPSDAAYRSWLDCARKMLRQLGLSIEVPDARPASPPKGYK